MIDMKTGISNVSIEARRSENVFYPTQSATLKAHAQSMRNGRNDPTCIWHLPVEAKCLRMKAKVRMLKYVSDGATTLLYSGTCFPYLSLCVGYFFPVLEPMVWRRR